MKDDWHGFTLNATRGTNKTTNCIQLRSKCAFGLKWKIKIISLFNLFLLLFMSPTILFQLTFTLSIVLSTIIFQFQQNKWYPNTSVHLDWNEKIKIISLFSLFLLLFMGPTAFFGTIHGLHCTISTNFLPLSTVLSAIIFQFQQNKRYLNTP